MSLQHHAIVHYCALQAGVSPSGKYVVLGDDIVICDDLIAKQYQTVIKELGVQISPQKTHISKDICEFAKRWMFRGSEISAFPLHSIKNNLKRYYLLQNSIQDARGKGYLFCNETHERVCIIKLMQLTAKKAQAPRLFKLYKLFDCIVSKETDRDKYIGNIQKCILANWKVPDENVKLYFKDLKTFDARVDFSIEEFLLDVTSDGNNEMMEVKDQERK
jgi:hypothetical protein